MLFRRPPPTDHGRTPSGDFAGSRGQPPTDRPQCEPHARERLWGGAGLIREDLSLAASQCDRLQRAGSAIWFGPLARTSVVPLPTRRGPCPTHVRRRRPASASGTQKTHFSWLTYQPILGNMMGSKWDNEENREGNREREREREYRVSPASLP